ncbi:MAG: hypothetical protein EBR23_00470 [Planctomycetia bacterium]|nr:hypothetical protein [Planctomycetia bacterium]
MFSSTLRRRRFRSVTLQHRLGLEPMEMRRLLTAGLTVTPSRGLTTSEDGGSAIVRMALTQQPTADVTIPLASSNVLEGQVDKSQLVFTPANWNVVQQVRVTGQPDGVRDGNKVYQLITGDCVSTDPAYGGLMVKDATITNKDSRTLVAGATVKRTSGLKTTEDGGTDVFTVKLNYRPVADVSIVITSDNPGEGIADVGQLVFTPANYGVPQTVTITGQPDGVRDGTRTYHIVTGNTISTDPLYLGLAVSNVTVRNLDSRILVAGITVTPTTGLKTSELGAATAFGMVLRYRPTADVTVPLSSSNPSAGLPGVGSVTFTPANWNVPQMVSVTGRDDGLFNGDVRYRIVTGPAVSSDPLYSGRNAADVSILNIHRTDVGRYDGVYTGTYSGTVSGSGPINGPVRAEIRGGVITVSLPGTGDGTLSTGGGVDFSVSSGSVQGAVFVGRLASKTGTSTVTGAGTWTYLDLSGVSANGRWNVLRTGL